MCVLTEQNLDSFLHQNLFGLVADDGQHLWVCQLHFGMDQNHLETRLLTGFKLLILISNFTALYS